MVLRTNPLCMHASPPGPDWRCTRTQKRLPPAAPSIAQLFPLLISIDLRFAVRDVHSNVISGSPNRRIAQCVFPLSLTWPPHSVDGEKNLFANVLSTFIVRPVSFRSLSSLFFRAIRTVASFLAASSPRTACTVLSNGHFCSPPPRTQTNFAHFLLALLYFQGTARWDIATWKWDRKRFQNYLVAKRRDGSSGNLNSIREKRENSRVTKHSIVS